MFIAFAFFVNFHSRFNFVILTVLSSCFMLKTRLISLSSRFCMFLAIFIFESKLTILRGLQLLHSGHFFQFSTDRLISILLSVFGASFCIEQLLPACRIVLSLGQQILLYRIDLGFRGIHHLRRMIIILQNFQNILRL